MNDLLDDIRKLATAAGLDENVVSDLQILSAIQRRARASRRSGEVDYECWARDDQSEKDEILEDLLVRESWFFRDREPFEALKNHLHNVRTESTDIFKVLSAPCANGEEPYSLAMTLFESGLTQSLFTVDALDISHRGLEYARVGCYQKSALREVPGSIRLRYFAAGNDDCFTVCAAVRDSIVFHHTNLVNLSETLRTQRFNAIYCRNALIYLNKTAREQVIENLFDMLLPGGLLVVGHAESALVPRDRFTSFGRPGSFAFRKEARKPAKKNPPGEKRLGRSTPKTPQSRSPTHPLTAVPPAADKPVGHQAEEMEAILTVARAKADSGDYTEAQASVLEALRLSPTEVEAHHLLGLVYAAQNEFALARKSFECALYLHPDFGPSIQHLSLLFESEGAQGKAARLRKRVNASVNNQ